MAAAGAVDREARERGVTVYMPDRRSPLHPEAIGEGTGSLLPDADRAALRGGVSVTVPAQEVAPAPAGGYVLRFDAPLPVEDWNAQVSLLTGMAAARIMIDGGVGLFRTLEPAQERGVASLRRSALALGVDWPEGARYADVVRRLDPRRPGHAARRRPTPRSPPRTPT